MSELIKSKNIFNALLFIWVISIPFKNSVYQISTVSLILFFIVYIIKNKDFSYLKVLIKKYKDVILSCFLIILSMTISNIINDVSKTSAWSLELKFIYRYIFIFTLLIYFYSKKVFTKKLLFIFIFISLLIQGLDGVYQSIFGYDIFKHNIGNVLSGFTGATHNRNIFAFFIGIGVIISFLSINKENLLSKINLLFIPIFVLFIYYTLFAYSRAIWVSLFISFFTYALLNYKNIKFKHIICFTAILFGLIFMFITVDSLHHRLDQLLAGNSSHRTDIWLHAIELIKEQPIFGWGINSFIIHGYKNITSIHNATFEVLTDLGFIGLFTFLLFVLLSLKEIIIYKSKELALIAAYFMVNSQFGESIISSKTLLSSLTIFLFYIYSNRLKKEVEK